MIKVCFLKVHTTTIYEANVFTETVFSKIPHSSRGVLQILCISALTPNKSKSTAETTNPSDTSKGLQPQAQSTWKLKCLFYKIPIFIKELLILLTLL